MRGLWIAVVALGLSGCVTVSNTLSPTDVASFKLTRVDVAVPADARISWGDGEVAYASTKGIAPQDAGSVSETPEARAYVRQGVSTRLKSAFERELSGRMIGARPVRVEVTVREVQIASVLQRILIGGSHSMRADVAVVDAKTGAVISQFPAQTATSQAGQGLAGAMIDSAVGDAPIDRVTANYAELYRGWLFRS